MPRDFYGGFAPNFNTGYLVQGGAIPTGYSLVATTTTGASPPRAARWLKVDDTSSAKLTLMTSSLGEPAISPFMWDCITWRIEGSLGVGTSDPIFEIGVDGGDSVVRIWWVRSSADKWQVRATKTGGDTIIATGSTEYDHDTTVELRWQLDGTNIKVWVNRTLEIDTAYTGTMKTGVFLRAYFIGTSGVEHYICQHGRFGSNSESDLPDSDVSVQGPVQNGQGPDDDYKDQAAGSSGDAEPADIDLDGSLDVDESIYWQGDAGAAWEQNVELTTVTKPSGFTVEGVVIRTASTSNIIGKTVSADHQLLDQVPNTVEETMSNLGSTNFGGRSTVHPAPPGGGDWDDFTLADLRAGVTTVDTNGAHDFHAALVVEVCSVATDADAPPAAVGTGVDEQAIMGII